MGNSEKYDNIITYEDKIKDMGKGKNNKKGANRRKAIEFVKKNLVGILFVVLQSIVMWFIHDLPQSVTNLEINTARMEAKLETLEANYLILNANVWSTRVENENAGEIEEETMVVIASTDITAGMFKQDKKSGILSDLEELEDETVIGRNRESGNDETKSSVENKAFITQYTENEEDVFFYGQYDENGQWDGRCIINRYNGSKLTFIMDAVYNNGILEKYSQVFRGTNTRGQEIWYVSKREVDGNENSGETTTYFYFGDYEKNFDIQTISKEDMMSMDKFMLTIPSTIEGYYNGYTSDGRYNDDSEDAYLIKYDTNGNVRYLYKGILEDGYGNDNRNNADSWALIWGDANDGYHYHKGKFKDGTPVETKKAWKYPVDQEFIDSIINPEDYNCPLTGLIE